MYGENTNAIRTELAHLLRQHRIQQRIGGAGSPTVPQSTTLEDRAEIGRLLQRYRQGILTWCHQAVMSASPSLRLAGPDRRSTPDAELSRCLQHTLDASTSPLPSLEDLTTPQPFPLIEAWRRAARAASLGEHDLAGEMAPGRLDATQRLTVAKDAAEIIRALLVLDHRYRGIPGWEPLRRAPALQRAAEACAFLQAADFSIDRLGWRPPARAIAGPPRPGIAGVLQAEHNLLIGLKRFPTALNLRRILDSQRELSGELARRYIGEAPTYATRWAQREATYAALHREARNIGGPLGSGAEAAAQSANAVTRLRAVPKSTLPDLRVVRDLDRIFGLIDERLAEIIEHGARERLYFARAKVPRLNVDDGHLAHAVRERFMPIGPPVGSELLRMVHEMLPAHPTVDSPSTCAGGPRAGTGRIDLRQAILHRPPGQNPAPGL